jgi:hypothetical protein
MSHAGNANGCVKDVTVKWGSQVGVRFAEQLYSSCRATGAYADEQMIR